MRAPEDGGFGIHFGALSDPICTQLREQEVRASKRDVELWQRFADAIVILRIHSILPDSQAHACHKRLMKMIAAGVTPEVPA